MALYTVITVWVVSLILLPSIIAFSAFVRSKVLRKSSSDPKPDKTSETNLDIIKRIIADDPAPEIMAFLEETLGQVIIRHLKEEQRPLVIEELRRDERDGVIADLKESERRGVRDKFYKRERSSVRASIRKAERHRLWKEGMIHAMTDNYRKGIERGRDQILEDIREALRVARRREDESDEDDESSSD